jgi:hypothetical protein
VVAQEFVVNRLDLAAKVGHLCVACQLVAGELRHLVRVVMRDTGLLSRPGEAVLARGPLAPLDQQMQSAPQIHEPLSQIGRDAHATDVTVAAKHVGVKCLSPLSVPVLQAMAIETRHARLAPILLSLRPSRPTPARL